MSESVADKVREYFKIFPNLTFEQVEGFIPDLTIENFRTIKSRLKNKNGQEENINYNNNKNNSNYYSIKNVKSNFHDQPNNTEKFQKKIDSIEDLMFDMINVIITISEQYQEENIIIHSFALSSLEEIEKKLINLNQKYYVECIQEAIDNFKLDESEKPTLGMVDIEE